VLGCKVTALGFAACFEVENSFVIALKFTGLIEMKALHNRMTETCPEKSRVVRQINKDTGKKKMQEGQEKSQMAD
jgi:hypothetical protein